MKRIIIFLFLFVSLLFPAVHKHPEEKNNYGLCPVLAEPASKEFSYEYKGKKYYFCCQDCVEKFKKAPETYISRIKEIKVEAFQFGYLPEVIKVKKGDIVRIMLTTRDVPHGFMIKEYGIDVKVKKGEKKEFEFLADKKGEFDIICSVYCGKNHSKMKGKLIVE